jgi:hypothetical protein
LVVYTKIWTHLIFIFGNNPGTNHPRMLTSLQKAKDQGAKIIAVNPLPEVSLMHVTNPNPQDYPNPLELPIALLGHGQKHSRFWKYFPMSSAHDFNRASSLLMFQSSSCIEICKWRSCCPT